VLTLAVQRIREILVALIHFVAWHLITFYADDALPSTRTSGGGRWTLVMCTQVEMTVCIASSDKHNRKTTKKISNFLGLIFEYSAREIQKKKETGAAQRSRRSSYC
jgi:hypothetical protein